MSKTTRHPVRRTAAGVLASALALSGAVVAASPANAAAGFALDRLAGNDRYETSAAIAAAFGVNSVVYTFDQAVTQTQADANDFGLVDANGVLFTPTGTGVLGSNGTTVTFTGAAAGAPAAGFTNAQAAAAVIANVEDDTAATADLTTGDVPVQRG